MERTITYTVPEQDTSRNVMDYLHRQGCPRHLLTAAASAGDILVNGSIPPTYAPVHPGDVILLRVRETEEPGHLTPAPVDFRILYQDPDILVVDKPAGTPIHPSQGNHGNTLAEGVAWTFAQEGEPFVFRCLNRLDRNTGGLVLIARHALSAAILSRQMSQRRIHRTYRALVLGRTPAEGIIDAPIGRVPGSIILRQIDREHGDTAITHYRTLAHLSGDFGPYSLLELWLETGRTHQIRVHMSSLGHPLLGDGLYHPQDPSPLTRQALHSYALEFDHPITGEPLRFTCPLPQDMQALIPSQESSSAEDGSGYPYKEIL